MAFELDHVVQDIFLDLSKVFDRVWRLSLIFKLKQIGIEGEILGSITIFLEDRYQRVILDGETSKWAVVVVVVVKGTPC